MSETFLYTIWFAFPAFFLGTALWAKLEQLSKSVKKQNPGDFFRQGFFLLVCVFISIGIDQYVLRDPELQLPSWVPLELLQIILLPLVLLIVARLVGGVQANQH